MKRILLTFGLAISLFGISQAQPVVGSVKTEQYQADFEKKQSIAVVSDYDDTIIYPIQVLKIGINEELYTMYPELKDKRVGLGVANIVLEFLESTDRFKFTEDKEEIKQKVKEYKEKTNYVVPKEVIKERNKRAYQKRKEKLEKEKTENI